MRKWEALDWRERLGKKEDFSRTRGERIIVAKEIGNKRRMKKYRKCSRKKNQNGRREIKCVSVKKEQIYLVRLKKPEPQMSNYYIKIHVQFCIYVCHILPKFEGNFQILEKCIPSSEDMLLNFPLRIFFSFQSWFFNASAKLNCRIIVYFIQFSVWLSELHGKNHLIHFVLWNKWYCKWLSQ